MAVASGDTVHRRLGEQDRATVARAAAGVGEVVVYRG
jgi:hypothetical protein